MTIVAAVSDLPEETARALAGAIGEHDLLAELSLDLSESSPGLWRVAVYFEDVPGRTEKAALAAVAGRERFTYEQLPDTDWVAKSLEGLKPVRAGRFVVYGHHDRAALKPNDIGIEIEAGLAFGTGHHGTTAGCLKMIDHVVRARDIANALDVGTGSGVLAIAIARTSRARVTATDIDPIAVKVARDNARLNGVAARITAIVAGTLAGNEVEADSPYDLVVANILAGPLVSLAPAIERHTAPGGTVILSGLLPEQRARIVAAYRGAGLRLKRAEILDGWLTLVFERPPSRLQRPNVPRSMRSTASRS
jgi:ribosomal protein L11 methyltransferase